MSLPLGGVKTTTLLNCPRCERGVAIPPGEVLRVPADRPRGYCHEILNPHTGVVSKRG